MVYLSLALSADDADASSARGCRLLWETELQLAFPPPWAAVWARVSGTVVMPESSRRGFTKRGLLVSCCCCCCCCLGAEPLLTLAVSNTGLWARTADFITALKLKSTARRGLPTLRSRQGRQQAWQVTSIITGLAAPAASHSDPFFKHVPAGRSCD